MKKPGTVFWGLGLVIFLASSALALADPNCPLKWAVPGLEKAGQQTFVGFGVDSSIDAYWWTINLPQIHTNPKVSQAQQNKYCSAQCPGRDIKSILSSEFSPYEKCAGYSPTATVLGKYNPHPPRIRHAIMLSQMSVTGVAAANGTCNCYVQLPFQATTGVSGKGACEILAQHGTKTFCGAVGEAGRRGKAASLPTSRCREDTWLEWNQFCASEAPKNNAMFNNLVVAAGQAEIASDANARIATDTPAGAVGTGAE